MRIPDIQHSINNRVRSHFKACHACLIYIVVHNSGRSVHGGMDTAATVVHNYVVSKISVLLLFQQYQCYCYFNNFSVIVVLVLSV